MWLFAHAKKNSKRGSCNDFATKGLGKTNEMKAVLGSAPKEERGKITSFDEINLQLYGSIKHKMKKSLKRARMKLKADLDMTNDEYEKSILQRAPKDFVTARNKTVARLKVGSTL